MAGWESRSVGFDAPSFLAQFGEEGHGLTGLIEGQDCTTKSMTKCAVQYGILIYSPAPSLGVLGVVLAVSWPSLGT